MSAPLPIPVPDPVPAPLPNQRTASSSSATAATMPERGGSAPMSRGSASSAGPVPGA
jgi:hypothetical protein